MIIFQASVADAWATLACRALDADDHVLLFETHRTAGLKCGQCHQERPAKLAPPATTCLGCHGDQEALANMTREASPNPHAPPHLPYRRSPNLRRMSLCLPAVEVSRGSCHRDCHFDVK